MILKLKPLSFLLALALVSNLIPFGAFASSGGNLRANAATEPGPQAGSASQALKQGRALLKRGKADLALVQLQNALSSFKQAGNPKGVAAANDALGDLYVRQGQYGVAVKFYQDAHGAFREAVSKQGAVETTIGMPDNEFNANLMLAKIGDTYYR